MTPQKIQELLVDCQKRKIPVFVGSNGIDISFQTLIKSIEDSQLLLENMVRPEYIRKFTSGSKFFLQCKMIRLQSSATKPHGSLMAFLMEDNSVIEETRQSERFMFSPEERVIADILNPWDHKTMIKRPVMDMSATGLSLRMNIASKAFAPGTMLPDVKVVIDGKPYTRASAEVVYNRRFMDLQGRLRVQVGVKFVGDPASGSSS